MNYFGEKLLSDTERCFDKNSTPQKEKKINRVRLQSHIQNPFSKRTFKQLTNSG
jgi:hypothetical protein